MLPLNLSRRRGLWGLLYLASDRRPAGSIIACDGGIDIRGIRPASGVAPV